MNHLLGHSRVNVARRMGNDAIRARVRLKIDKIRRLAADGLTRKEAADAMGVTELRLMFFTKKHLGTGKWPPEPQP